MDVPMPSPTRLVITTEARLQRRADGSVWHDPGGRGYSFWSRYLSVFDEVVVVARVFPVSSDVAADVEGPGVTVHPLPGYSGITGFARAYRPVRDSLATLLDSPADAYIARVPSPIGSLLIAQLRRRGRGYCVEVVGDPFDLLAPGVLRVPLRPFVRYLSGRQLRRQCRGAAAGAYVTAGALQRRYPPAPDAYAAAISDVDLTESDLVGAPRHQFPLVPGRLGLISVGMLSRHKGHDLLVDAAAGLERELAGVTVSLAIVGEGPHRGPISRRVARHGRERSTRLLGSLSAGPCVRQQLDRADVFVLPSRGGEGLPRALLEAMARGLPCVASDLGGVAELLAPEDVVRPGDEAALIQLLRAVVCDPGRARLMSERNLRRAGAYTDRALTPARVRFLQAALEVGRGAPVCSEDVRQGDRR